MKVEIGYKLHIWKMEGEPQYCDKEGIVEHIDDIGQIHGTWGGCALIPGRDKFEIVDDENKANTDKHIDTKAIVKILYNADDSTCGGMCDNCCKCAEYAAAKKVVEAGYGDIKREKEYFAEQLIDRLESAAMCFGRDPDRDAGIYIMDAKRIIKEILGGTKE